MNYPDSPLKSARSEISCLDTVFILPWFETLSCLVSQGSYRVFSLHKCFQKKVFSFFISRSSSSSSSISLSFLSLSLFFSLEVCKEMSFPAPSRSPLFKVISDSPDYSMELNGMLCGSYLLFECAICPSVGERSTKLRSLIITIFQEDRKGSEIFCRFPGFRTHNSFQDDTKSLY